MAGSARPQRVAGEVHAALVEILRTVKDPRVTALSITGVRVTPDLQTAHVRYTPLGGQGDAREIARGLRAAGGYLRRELAKRLSLRRVPELLFHLDDGIDDAIRVTHLIDELGASTPPAGDGGEDEP